MILDGKKIAGEIYDEIEAEVQGLETAPKLGVVLIGNDPVSVKYIEQKQKAAEKIGIDFEVFQLEEFTIEEELLDKIRELNNDKTISGYIVQLPLPSHITDEKILAAISPKKDVDGFHPENQGGILIGNKNTFTPCTPAGIMKLLSRQNIEFQGKEVCVIGRSNIVGKPLAMLLINSGATVTSCNSHTKDLKKHTKNADIIISATGHTNLIGIEHLKDNNTIVIDVGFQYQGIKITGDCDFENIHKNGNLITPVPGGVGPMTVAMLMKNTLKAYHLNN